MFRKGSHKSEEFYKGLHRFEHWYRDRTIYFITARCRGQIPAFETENCKDIFWDRFTYYSTMFGFVPIIVSLLDNHYYILGYLEIGGNLGKMMQRLHGSVAKLVNDRLEQKIKPFWVDRGHQNYFDGCIRDTIQFRRTYRYVLTQCIRHGICVEPGNYQHTRAYIEVEPALVRALRKKAFLDNVPYARYEKRRRRSR